MKRTSLLTDAGSFTDYNNNSIYNKILDRDGFSARLFVT